MTNEPTDAEIIALNAGEIHFSESPTKYPEAGHGTQYHAGAPGIVSFARAVLARWGLPSGAGPVAWRHRMGPNDIWVECSKEFHDWVVREPSSWPRDEVQALCIATPQPTQAVPPVTPCRKNPFYHGPRNCCLGTVGCCEDHGKDRQPQAVPPAGREPLTRGQVKTILSECGYDGASAQHRANLINGLRHGEAAHGIKGGQHG